MGKRVIALGFFDGVHIGHAALLHRVVSIAEKRGATPAVMTYSRHPSEVVGKEPVRLLNTTEERRRIISEQFGISDIIVRDFTRDYASLGCSAFVDEIIIKELGACHVVAGFDFRFGSCGAGDAEKLKTLCAERGLGCDIVDEVSFDGAAVSSSRIRECIAQGDMERAEKMLGHYHCIISKVSRGAALGKKLGFPTVNLALAENIEVPRFGVYLSRASFDGKVYTGVTNIGIKPTVEDNARPAAETNLLGFSGDLYGEEIKLELVRFLRPERKFSSIEELKRQIGEDVEKARLLADRLF